MRVDVIIPHLKGEETLLPLLEDLAAERESTPGLEVLLVDNASTDGSVERARREHPWIRVLALERNEGYAGGCNRGIEATDGEWVWLLNDDVRLEKGVVQAMLEVAGADDRTAAVQPKILSLVHPGSFDYAGGGGGLMDVYGYPFAMGRIGGELERDRGQYDEVREIFWASGTACLWRRRALERIGLLDESFFAHMEEIDLAWRAWNAGWRVLSAPKGAVSHLGGGTLAYQAWRKMYLNHRNALSTVLKNREARHLLWLLPVRFALDHGIALAEAAQGRPGRFTAVWAGWLAFLARVPATLAKRRAAQALRTRRDRDLRNVVYEGSILFAYLRGLRSAGELLPPPEGR